MLKGELTHRRSPNSPLKVDSLTKPLPLRFTGSAFGFAAAFALSAALGPVSSDAFSTSATVSAAEVVEQGLALSVLERFWSRWLRASSSRRATSWATWSAVTC
jgi:hypothetical protein